MNIAVAKAVIGDRGERMTKLKQEIVADNESHWSLLGTVETPYQAPGTYSGVCPIMSGPISGVKHFGSTTLQKDPELFVTGCMRERCAWWDSAYGKCAAAALVDAMVVTR